MGCIPDNFVSELLETKDHWEPPMINEYEMALKTRRDVVAGQSNCFFYIFQIEPYIDAIYIEYTPYRTPAYTRRYVFREGYEWNGTDERFFHEHCVKNGRCAYHGDVIWKIFELYNREHPEWHLQPYYTHGLRLLDHIHNCMKQSTVQEILYKAGLDELAVHIDDIDELNLLASKPSELYDGLSMKVLRSLNCPYGAKLLEEYDVRVFLKDLNMKFPNIFKEPLNDAMCRYLLMLIKGDLTVGEAGRLFESRREDLAKIWTNSLMDVFMAMDIHDQELRKLCEYLGSLDPIYDHYIKGLNHPAGDANFKQLKYLLTVHREEYDQAIRRSNRRRDYDWQERGEKYYVRYPQTIHDFCREGIYMQNCLLTYTEAMINNDTTILFMRKAEDVNRPFITLEVYKGELMQAYHRFNNDCTKEEAEWILAYCKRHGIGTGKFHFDTRVDQLF